MLAAAIRLYARLIAEGGSDERQALAELLPKLPGREPGSSAAPFLQLELARSLVGAGRHGEAEALLYAFNYTVHGTLTAPIHRLRGIALEGLGQPEEARRHYRRFVDMWRAADSELQGRVSGGRESQSLAFFKTPGIEPLYSGVASRRPSEEAIQCFSSVTRSGRPASDSRSPS